MHEARPPGWGWGEAKLSRLFWMIMAIKFLLGEWGMPEKGSPEYLLRYSLISFQFKNKLFWYFVSWTGYFKVQIQGTWGRGAQAGTSTIVISHSKQWGCPWIPSNGQDAVGCHLGRWVQLDGSSNVSRENLHTTVSMGRGENIATVI